MPSSGWRIEEEQREAVGARLGVEGAKGWQGGAQPQLGADGTRAVQGYPVQLPLALWSLGPVETARRGQEAQPGSLLYSGREMKTFFFSLVVEEKVFQVKGKAPTTRLRALYKPQ